jgi:hypothetical protein
VFIATLVLIATPDSVWALLALVIVFIGFGVYEVKYRR